MRRATAMTPMPTAPQTVEVNTVMRKLADSESPPAELGQLFGFEARLPPLRRCRVEFDIARRLAPVVLGNHGQLAVLAGIRLAAEPAPLAGERQARLADDRDRHIEIRRCGLALGMQRQLVVAGRS